MKSHIHLIFFLSIALSQSFNGFSQIVSPMSQKKGQVKALIIDTSNHPNSDWIQWSNVQYIPLYTSKEVDDHIEDASTIQKKIIENQNTVLRNQEKQITALEQQLEQVEGKYAALIKQSIDKLPQRLLSEEVIEAIKNSVLSDFHEEILKLNLEIKDMQKQIDELKSSK